MQKLFSKQYVLPLVITLVLLCICLEVYTRYKLSNGGGLYAEILQKENFPQISELIADRKKSVGLKYYDYHIFANTPRPTELMTFTEYYSARNVPDSLPVGTSTFTIWLFGGSTMQNMETIDELTIANQLAKNLNENNTPATVVNFGVGGFQSSIESIKFQDILRRVPENEHPNVVIFYDGFNDAGQSAIFKAGSLQQDLSRKMEALVEGHHGKLLFYSLSNIIGEYSAYWKDRLSYKMTKLIFGEELIMYDRDNLTMALDIYEDNTRMIRGICQEFNIRPIFLLQPMIYTKNNLTEFEKKIHDRPGAQKTISFMKDYYQQARSRMAQYEDFYDITSILNDSKRNDFFDLGHTGPYTGMTIGQEISEIVIDGAKSIH